MNEEKRNMNESDVFPHPPLNYRNLLTVKVIFVIIKAGVATIMTSVQIISMSNMRQSDVIKYVTLTFIQCRGK